MVDHCDAIRTVLAKGHPGQTYCIGGEQEMSNLEVVTLICEHLQTLRPSQVPYQAQVQFVKDRPGHDRRYAMNITRIRQELAWTPKETFKTGIQKTIEWYLANPQWVADVTSGSYRDWIKVQYQSAP